MQLLWQAELQIALLRISHLGLLLFMLCISVLIFISFFLLPGEAMFALMKGFRQRKGSECKIAYSLHLTCTVFVSR